ncbi:MAG TPA: cytochrome b [Arenimonas sp.]|uniref:cytochrome b n=1 Tax=Arenimonas sp. TaxID=1872635 RepID=UPI002D807F3F|nr:cytochrome b [Arenimonas sp.]HEU0153257.1 cytochrome b [Arenimonas sp.]
MDTRTHYDRTARWLHWTMAAMILAMIFIGVGMVASLESRPWLLALHRPLGLLVLALATWRLWHRWRHPAPALPDSVPAPQARLARTSHVLLYALMFTMPLLGWAMSSAGGYPVALPGGAVLPALAPQDAALYTFLRSAHGVLGYAFFGLILLHLSGALFHAWVRRDGVFESMK